MSNDKSGDNMPSWVKRGPSGLPVCQAMPANDGSGDLISVARGLHATTYIDRDSLAILLVVRRYS